MISEKNLTQLCRSRDPNRKLRPPNVRAVNRSTMDPTRRACRNGVCFTIATHETSKNADHDDDQDCGAHAKSKTGQTKTEIHQTECKQAGELESHARKPLERRTTSNELMTALVKKNMLAIKTTITDRHWRTKNRYQTNFPRHRA